jgi:hypothetical protein
VIDQRKRIGIDAGIDLFAAMLQNFRAQDVELRCCAPSGVRDALGFNGVCDALDRDALDRDALGFNGVRGGYLLCHVQIIVQPVFA